MSPSKRLAYGLEVGFLLAFIACAYGAAFVFQAKQAPWTVWVVVLTLPLLAAWVFAFLHWVSAAFAGEGRLSTFTVFSLPLVFVAICAVISKLTVTPSNALAAPFPELESVRLWSDPVVLLGLYVVQGFALTFMSYRERSRP